MAKTCILSLRSDLYEYKGMLLREYEYVVQQVLRSKNHGATNFNMYISDFREIHYKAITTATSNCERFPY